MLQLVQLARQPLAGHEPFAFFGGALDSANPYQQALGSAYIAQAFRAAHAADPAATLFLNETNIELDDAKLDATIALASSLLAAGVPLHGIGFQGHFFYPPDLDDLSGRLQRVADLGLAVELTEVDLAISRFAGARSPCRAGLGLRERRECVPRRGDVHGCHDVGPRGR